MSPELTIQENAAIADGALELRRKVRWRRRKNPRKGQAKKRALNCSIKRGHIFEVGGVFVRVVGVNRDGDWWAIQLESTGSWAVPKPIKWDCVIPYPVAMKILNGPRPTALKWPNPCPVHQGQVIRLADDSVEVTIGSPFPTKGEDGYTTKIRIADYRAETFLRRSPPATRNSRKSPTALDEAAARIDGAYTNRRELALDAGEHDEGVPANWQDKGAVVRELKRQQDRDEHERMRQEQAAKSRLNRLLRGADPKQAEHLLAGIVALCEEAEEPEDDQAA